MPKKSIVIIVYLIIIIGFYTIYSWPFCNSWLQDNQISGSRTGGYECTFLDSSTLLYIIIFSVVYWGTVYFLKKKKLVPFS